MQRGSTRSAAIGSVHRHRNPVRCYVWGLSNCGRGAAGVGRAVFCAVASGSIISNPTRRPVLPSRAQRSHTHSRESGSCRFGDSLQCSGIGQHRLTADRRSSQGLRLQQRLRRGACTSRVRVPRRNSGLMRRAVQLRPLRQPRSVVSSTSSSSPSLRLTLDQSLPPTVVPPAPFAIARVTKVSISRSTERCGSIPSYVQGN